MKGIYLTEEGKKELLKRIGSLKEIISLCILPEQQSVKDLLEQELFIKEEILSSATILPVEENWGIVEKQTNMMDEHQLRIIYDKGVIIQPKQ